MRVDRPLAGQAVGLRALWFWRSCLVKWRDSLGRMTPSHVTVLCIYDMYIYIYMVAPPIST